jgi:hypothetical protein
VSGLSAHISTWSMLNKTETRKLLVQNRLSSRLLSKNAKKKNIYILNYNFARGSVWVQNLVSHIKGGT